VYKVCISWNSKEVKKLQCVKLAEDERYVPFSATFRDRGR